MRAAIKTATAFIFFAGLVTLSAEARALTHETGVSANSQGAENASETDRKRHTEKKEKQPEAKKRKADKDNDFVDKDGDGIRDGKEHRFRHRSKHRKDAGRHTGKQQRRNRIQTGKGN